MTLILTLDILVCWWLMNSFLWAICILNRDSWRVLALGKKNSWKVAMPARNPFPLHKSHHTSGCQICLCIRRLWFPWDVTKGQGEEREECRVWHFHYLGSAHRCQLSEGGAWAHQAPCAVQTGLAWAGAEREQKLNLLPSVPWIPPSSPQTIIVPSGVSCYNLIFLSCTLGF